MGDIFMSVVKRCLELIINVVREGFIKNFYRCIILINFKLKP
uniref:Uncharacterized protein n=1 Tax=Meloidogyne enterolobii TaxID=390850 RepID=A0A6V7XA17_MELEN|nr:unnamed protein product [Meloidogyne enterolobii]